MMVFDGATSVVPTGQVYAKAARSKRNEIDTKWSDSELYNLALAIQVHGFKDVNTFLNLITTKDEVSLKQFIETSRLKAAPKVRSKKSYRRRAAEPTPEDEFLWPIIRKWRKIASHQMAASFKTQDYSKMVMPQLCQRFYEEQPEPSNPQLVNYKAIYKYLSDCMSGTIPAELPPLESALLYRIHAQMEQMVSASESQHEKNFLRNFRKAYSFRPPRVKEEFQKAIPDDDIVLDVETFEGLTRHRKLVQNFNPLGVPVFLTKRWQVWLQQVINSIPDVEQESQ